MGRKYLQTTILTKDLYLECIKNSQNSILKKRKKNKPSIKWVKDMNGHLTERDLLMENKHMEKWPISAAIRGVKLKPQKRYYHTPIRMMKIKYSDNIKCCQRCKGTGSGKCF